MTDRTLRCDALVLCATLLLAAGAARAEERAPLETDEQRAAYALGAQLAAQVQPLDLDAAEFRALQEGLEDATNGHELALDPLAYRERLRSLRSARKKRVTAREREGAKAFLGQAAREKGAVTLASGLVYRELEPGEGESPKANSVVRVLYRGELRDGTVFDHSDDRDKPSSFSLRRVIPCWREGIQRMKPGGKSVLFCPDSIAYGDRGFPPRIPPGAALRFEVELIEVVR